MKSKKTNTVKEKTDLDIRLKELENLNVKQRVEIRLLKEQLNMRIVSQQRELKPQVKKEKATWQCDECDKWYEPSDKCPHCGFCG